MNNSTKMNLDDFDSFLPVGAASSAIKNMQVQDGYRPELSDGSMSLEDNDGLLTSMEFNVDASRHSSGSENEMSSLSTTQASYEGHSTSPESSESSDNDDEFDLAFLSEKRRILQRYCDVVNSKNAYNASIAKEPICSPLHSIWDEAKEMMEELFDAKDSPKTCNSPTMISQPVTFKRPRIDTSMVTRIDASEYDKGSGKLCSSSCAENSLAFYDSSHLVDALEHLSSVGRVPAVVSDVEAGDEPSVSSKIEESFTTKVRPGVVAPTSRPKKRRKECIGTTMEEVLSITDVALLLCQANAPFTVMHANKAFFTFSHLCTVDIIGKSLEDVVRFEHVQEVISKSMNDDEPDFTTVMLGDKRCQVQVKPVLSQSISHVVVQIYSDDAAAFAKAAISAAKHRNVLVGCVG